MSIQVVFPFNIIQARVVYTVRIFT